MSREAGQKDLQRFFPTSTVRILDFSLMTRISPVHVGRMIVQLSSFETTPLSVTDCQGSVRAGVSVGLKAITQLAKLGPHCPGFITTSRAGQGESRQGLSRDLVIRDLQGDTAVIRSS